MNDAKVKRKTMVRDRACDCLSMGRAVAFCRTAHKSNIYATRSLAVVSTFATPNSYPRPYGSLEMMSLS